MDGRVEEMCRGKDPADDIVGRCAYCYLLVEGLGKACCGGGEEMGELGAVEAAGGVDGWDGDVEVEDGDVDVHLPSCCCFHCG